MIPDFGKLLVGATYTPTIEKGEFHIYGRYRVILPGTYFNFISAENESGGQVWLMEQYGDRFLLEPAAADACEPLQDDHIPAGNLIQQNGKSKQILQTGKCALIRAEGELAVFQPIFEAGYVMQLIDESEMVSLIFIKKQGNQFCFQCKPI